MGRDPSRGRSRRKAGMKPELGAEVVKPLALGATTPGPWRSGHEWSRKGRQGSLTESRDWEEGGLPRPGA